MKYSTENIRGIDYEIEVDHRGQFICKADGDDLEDVTFEGLKKKLMEHSRTKQKNINIPFIFWSDDFGHEEKIQRGICVGLHAGNNNLLVKLGSGGVQQLASWRCEKVFAPERMEELKRLRKNLKKAQGDLEKFTDQHSLNLRAMILKLLA
jgi:hypothetical protein